MTDLATDKSAPERIKYTLLYDYMFRAVMQSNKRILRSLLSSLLSREEEELIDVEITNPIELGSAIDEKTFVLDLKILLNSNEIINIEMQVINQHNWPERSLGYLCRTFDNLNTGDDYALTKPALQISILDFTLFDDFPEFYAKYHLSNDKNHLIYTDKFALNVLDLTRIDLATDEDIATKLDIWAKAFKAKTYEDLKLLAKSYSVLMEVETMVKQLTEDEKIRQQCEARARYEAHERGMKKVISLLEGENTELKTENTGLKTENSDLKTQNSGLKTENSGLKTENTELKTEMASLKSEIDELKKSLAQFTE